MMMMSFIGSFRNNNYSADIYPLCTFHHGIKRHV
jgi:hypothetical protein